MNILTAITVSLALAAEQPARAPAIPPNIQSTASALVDGGYAPSIVIAVTDGDGHEFFALGKTATDGRPVDEETVYEIGSITKVFTSLLLAAAVERGDVVLDDPIQELMPDGVTVPSRGSRHITPADLARHCSGLPRLPANMAFDMNDPYAQYGSKELYAFLNDYELRADIGSVYEYSNLGAGLLGYAVSLHERGTYDEVLTRRVCAPLGLRHTRVSLTSEMKNHLARGHAADAAEPIGNWHFDALAGCGALRSTAADMIRFVEANLRPDSTALEQAIRLTHQGRFDTGTSGVSVALGWHVTNRHGVEVLWHNGGTGGYHSFCGFEPATGKGIVVLANSTYNIDPLGMHYFSEKFGLPEVRMATKPADVALADYDGYYKLSMGGVYHVVHRGNRLFATLSGQPEFEIFPEARDRYFYKVVDAQLDFERDDKGNVVALVLHQNGLDIRGKRLPADYKPKARKEVSIERDTLARYVGKYTLGPAEFDVTLSGEQLMVQLTGQPAVPVYAESETEFFYKVVDAQITFVLDDAGSVQSLILHQNGMDQQAKRVD